MLIAMIHWTTRLAEMPLAARSKAIVNEISMKVLISPQFLRFALCSIRF
jgi:hypothetical protein